MPTEQGVGRPASPFLRALLRERREHVDAVREALFAAYGEPENSRSGDPVSGLVATILSQSTTNINSDRAFASLRDRFPTWQQVVDAATGEVEEAIRSGGLARMKAPRIQGVLQAIHARFGGFDLSVLETLPRDEARHLLMGLGEGIGPKTASCVLLFSLDVPAFCVDTHIQRICARLGLIGARDSAEKAQHMLEATVPPEDTYAMHVDMIQHGREVCRAGRPRCHVCPLYELCLYGSTVHPRGARDEEPSA